MMKPRCFLFSVPHNTNYWIQPPPKNRSICAFSKLNDPKLAQYTKYQGWSFVAKARGRFNKYMIRYNSTWHFYPWPPHVIGWWEYNSTWANRHLDDNRECKGWPRIHSKQERVSPSHFPKACLDSENCGSHSWHFSMPPSPILRLSLSHSHHYSLSSPPRELWKSSTSFLPILFETAILHHLDVFLVLLLRLHMSNIHPLTHLKTRTGEARVHQTALSIYPPENPWFWVSKVEARHRIPRLFRNQDN